MALHPLQFGVPGGPELLVMFLLMLLFMGIPLLVIVLAVLGGVKLLGGSDDERVEELEQRVAELEGQLAEHEGESEDAAGDETGSEAEANETGDKT